MQMKISEFIVEGPGWDKFTNAVSNIPGGGWLARRGALGRTAQIGAYGKLQDKEQTALSNTLYRSMGVKFKTDLKRNLDAAMQAGRIATPLSEGSSYNDFNKLLESSIINEAPITLTQWLGDYVKALTTKYVKTADQESTITDRIKDLVALMGSYAADKQLPQKEVDNLWNAIWEIRSMQEPQKQSNEIEPPSLDITGSNPLKGKNKNFEYTFDTSSDTWSEWRRGTAATPGATPIKKFGRGHPRYNELNKLASESTDDIVSPPTSNIEKTNPLRGNNKNFEYTFDTRADTWSQWQRGKANTPGATPIQTFGNTHPSYNELNKLAASI